MKWFKGINNLKELKKVFFTLSKKYHPDLMGGNTEVMQEINAEYVKMRKKLQMQSSAYGIPATKVSGTEILLAIKAVSPFTDVKNTKASTGCVNLKAVAGRIILTTAFNKIQAKCSIPAYGGNEFEVSIPAKFFVSAIEKTASKDNKIEMFLVNSKLTIRNGKIEFALNATSEGKGQKVFEEVENKNCKLVIAKKDFCEMVKKLYPVTSKDKWSRAMFRAITFSAEGNKIQMFAATGIRVATISRELANTVEKAQFSISASILKIFADKVEGFKKHNGTINIFYDEETFLLKFDDYEVKGSFVSENLLKFDDYEVDFKNIIPQKPTIKAVLTKTEFQNFLQHGAILGCEDNSHAAEIRFIDGEGLKIRAHNAEIGSVEYFETAKVIGKGKVEVDVTQLQNALSGLEDTNVVIGLSITANGQQVFTLEELRDDNFIFAVAPLKNTSNQKSDIEDELQNVKKCMNTVKEKLKDDEKTLQVAKGIVENAVILPKIELKIDELLEYASDRKFEISEYVKTKLPKENKTLKDLKAELKKAKKSSDKSKVSELEEALKIAKAEFAEECKVKKAEMIDNEIANDKPLTKAEEQLGTLKKRLEKEKARIKRGQAFIDSNDIHKLKDTLRELA